MNRIVRLLTLPHVALLSSLLLAPVLMGCGGGSNSITRGTAPTAGTRTAVQRAMGRQVNSLNISGASAFQSGSLLGAANTAGGGVGAATGFAAPNWGGFFNQMAGTASAANGGRAASWVKRTRDVDSDFDEWLGLYTTLTETEGRTETLLFLDAAKTQPAGQILSIFPANYEIYPQVYRYTFTFSGGAQAGSEGHYDSIFNADGTYTSEYASTFADGTQYSGNSSYTPDGTSSYSGSYSSTRDNTSGSYEGQYRADGTGFSRSSDSTGYSSRYQYAANGSFTATVSGPDPGLPAQIVFDAETGRYTITYADGTSETFDWGYWITADSGSTPVASDDGSSDTEGSSNERGKAK